MISINGAAAHKANPGDLVIIATYAMYNELELQKFQPELVYVDATTASWTNAAADSGAGGLKGLVSEIRKGSLEAALFIWCREPESNRHAIASAGF